MTATESQSSLSQRLQGESSFKYKGKGDVFWPSLLLPAVELALAVIWVSGLCGSHLVPTANHMQACKFHMPYLDDSKIHRKHPHIAQIVLER